MENSKYSYSPFWPLQILLVFFLLWMGCQVSVLNGLRLSEEANIQQIVPQADNASAAKKRLLDLAQDLLQLSPRSTAATQIVTEFDIHVVAPEK